MGDNPAEKSNRPADTAFKQQKLPAWQPILTAGTVLPTFFVIGILFIPVGIGILFFSDSVVEHVVDYTDCLSGGEKCSDKVLEKNGTGQTTSCTCDTINFHLPKSMMGQVYVYYALTKFYQNHRRYVKSRDDQQLRGEVGSLSEPTQPDKSCEPFDKDDQGKIMYPCGAIANSLFTDKITLLKNGTAVPLKKEGIAWETDKTYKFKNPSFWKDAKGDSAHAAWNKFTKPRDWSFELWQWDGVEDEDFIVWMRTSAMPNFRKLYRIVNHKNASSEELKKGLPAGNYSLSIEYSFNVKEFGGTKSVVLSTTSIFGEKNSFLGIAYVVIGVTCLVLGILFLIIHIHFGKRNFIRPKDTKVPTHITGTKQPTNNASSAHNNTTSETDNTSRVVENNKEQDETTNAVST